MLKNAVLAIFLSEIVIIVGQPFLLSYNQFRIVLSFPPFVPGSGYSIQWESFFCKPTGSRRRV